VNGKQLARRLGPCRELSKYVERPVFQSAQAEPVTLAQESVDLTIGGVDV